MDLKAAHARALADLDEAHAQQKKAEEALINARQRVDELRSMADALERAMRLYEQPVIIDEGPAEAEALARTRGPSATHVPANGSLRIGDILAPDEAPSLTNLCLGALRHLARPASTQEVREKIAEIGGKEFNQGEDFNQEQVRGALSWLMKSERIVRVSPGTWVMIRKPAQPRDDFTPADTSAGVSKASESDPSSQTALSLERT